MVHPRAGSSAAGLLVMVAVLFIAWFFHRSQFISVEIATAHEVPRNDNLYGRFIKSSSNSFTMTVDKKGTVKKSSHCEGSTRVSACDNPTKGRCNLWGLPRRFAPRNDIIVFFTVPRVFICRRIGSLTDPASAHRSRHRYAGSHPAGLYR